MKRIMHVTGKTERKRGRAGVPEYESIQLTLTGAILTEAGMTRGTEVEVVRLRHGEIMVRRIEDAEKRQAEVEMKPCPSYPGYSATSDGRIISHRRKGKRTIDGTYSHIDPMHNHELSMVYGKKDYLQVGLRIGAWQQPRFVHVLVADAFLGPRPEGQVCRHIDGNKYNNSPRNLAYGTHFDNAADRKRHGRYATQARGSSHGHARLTSEQARSIRQEYASDNPSMAALGRKYGVSRHVIAKVVNGRSYVEPT